MSKIIPNNPYRIFLILLILVSLPAGSCSRKVWENKWVIAGAMNEFRAGASAIVVGSRLYIIGGIQGKEKGVLTNCEWAEIDKNGMLGKFKYTANLVEPRGFFKAVYYNGYIYAVGGANGEHGVNLLNTVERAKINPDGSLDEWILEKNKMFSARRGDTAVAAKGYIYAIGGFNGEFLDTVERAKVLEDGSLGKWELLPQILTVERYIHGSTMLGDYIYNFGGHERKGGDALDKVAWSKIDDKGDLSEWKETSPINIPRFLTKAIANKGYVFVIGGYDGNYIDAVETTTVNPDGSLGKWKMTAPLSIPRASMMIATYKDYIYVMGGATAPNGVFLNTIERATVNDKGELGNWK